MDNGEEILDDNSILNISTGDQLSQAASEAILSSVKWGRIYFFIIVGFFVLGLVGSVAMQSTSSGVFGAELNTVGIVGNAFSLFIYVALVFYPVYMFWKFISKTPKALERNEHASFVEGIGGLRSSIKYYAIFFFAILGLYVFILLIMLGTVGFN